MLDLVIGLAAGVVAGIVFFGGLRWTVSHLATSRHPLTLALGSFLFRVAFVSVMVVAVSEGRLTRLLAGLAGVLVTQAVVVTAVRRRLDATEESLWI